MAFKNRFLCKLHGFGASFTAWAVIFLLFFASFSVAADTKQQAESTAKTLSSTYHSYYGSESSVRNSVSPLVSSSSMTTFNGETTFNPQIECPNAHPFLEILFQPNATNDFRAVISEDTNDDGKYDYQIATPYISGVCSNGFISCDAGTWSNCRFYQWVFDGIKVNYSEVASDTSLGICFCVNSSCHGSVFSQFNQIASTFGQGLANEIAQIGDFAITDVKANFPTLTYYGESATKCTGGGSYSSLKNYYGDSTGLPNAGEEAAREKLSDENSAYYSLVNSEYMRNNPVSMRTCEIRRQVDLRKEVGDGMCEMRNWNLSEYVKNACSVPSDWVDKYNNFQLPGYIHESNFSCNGGSNDNTLIIVYIPPGLQRYISECKPTCGDGCDTLVIGDRDSDAVLSLRPNTKNHLFWTGKNVGSGHCNDYDDRGAAKVYYPRTIWFCNGLPLDGINYYTLNKDQCASECAYPTVKESKTDSCSGLDLSDCKLKDEQVCDYDGKNCVYTIRDFQHTGVSLTKNCIEKHDGNTNSTASICVDGNKMEYLINFTKPNGITSQLSGILETGDNVWWVVKRTYQCQAGDLTIPSPEREENIINNGSLDTSTGVLTYPDKTQEVYGIGGYDGTFQASYKSGFYDSCQYTCVVKEPAKRTNTLNGGSSAIDSSSSSGDTTRKKFIPCKKDQHNNWYCPVSGSETVVQPCTCLDMSSRSIAVFSATIQAAKDLTCSQE